MQVVDLSARLAERSRNVHDLVLEKEFLRREESHTSEMMHADPQRVQRAEHWCTEELRDYAQRIGAIPLGKPQIMWRCTVTLPVYCRPEGVTDQEWAEIAEVIAEVPAQQRNDTLVINLLRAWQEAE